MEVQMEQLADGVDKISLAGRLDSAGAQAIDMRFTALTATRKALIVVDLSELSFIASMGLRTLVTNARAQLKRGGKLVLARPQPLVGEVLKAAGIDAMIPIYGDLDSACSGLKAVAQGAG